MKGRMKRAISFVIVCCLIIGIVPSLGVTAQAASTVPSGYVGIYTAKDLDAVRNDLDGKYILMNDIDLSSWGDWTPIGEGSSSFSGVFDGNGHSIKNMRITDDTVYENAGLFAVLDGATIRNIKSVGGEIVCDSSPMLHVGAVAGQAYDSHIAQCANYVTIFYQNGEPDDHSYTSASGMRLCAGGIVGCSWGNTTIEECMNANKISGVAAGTPLNIGGIVGWFSDQ